MKIPINKIKRFLLLLFIFSLPFEYWDPFGISSSATVTKMAGFLYFAVAMLKARQSFAVKYNHFVISILFFLWAWIGIQSMFNYWAGTSFPLFNVTLFQCIILFWLISNDIIAGRIGMKQVFLFFVLGVFFMSVLAAFGIGIQQDISTGEVRISFFGSNPNSIGVFASLAFIMMFGMVIDKKKYFGRKTYLLLIAIPNILHMIGLSASRGAFVVVVVSLLLFFLGYRGSLDKKAFLLIVGTLILIFSINSILDSEIMRERVGRTMEEDSIGIREVIWGHSLQIFNDSPVFGHGTTGFEKEMTFRLGRFLDTHNLFLYFMVTGGVIGLIFYLLFFFKVFHSALFTYTNSSQIIFMVLFLAYTINILKAGGVVGNKLMWVVAAIVFSSKYIGQKKETYPF